jgi:NAD(P)-dependent dehydrogenase (short-subunit alcohol dehydrogenase family)
MPKHIIITGANGNMGSAAVKRFLSEDYHVIAVDHSGSHLGFAEGRSNFELHELSLDNEEASQDFFQEIISIKGQIDAALLLVGGFAMGGIETTDGKALKKMFAMNFESAYYAARPVFLHMLERGYGRIVFVGAKPGLVPSAGKGMIAYSLSKSLLFQLAALLNAEASGKNVVSSVIAPGTLDTPVNRAAMPAADTTSWISPEKVADILSFICSSQSEVLKSPVYRMF